MCPKKETFKNSFLGPCPETGTVKSFLLGRKMCNFSHITRSVCFSLCQRLVFTSYSPSSFFLNLSFILFNIAPMNRYHSCFKISLQWPLPPYWTAFLFNPPKSVSVVHRYIVLFLVPGSGTFGFSICEVTDVVTLYLRFFLWTELLSPNFN